MILPPVVRVFESAQNLVCFDALFPEPLWVQGERGCLETAVGKKGLHYVLQEP